MRPRAHFKGWFTVNVPTANNDKVSMTIDEASVEPMVPANWTDEEFRLWMMQAKQGMGNAVWLNSYYNYFGDHSMRFLAPGAGGNPPIPSVMTSSTLSDGTVCTGADDPFLNGRVELLGHPFQDLPGSAKMVDLDPIGIYGTQVFSGVFQVVVDSAQGPQVMLRAEDPTRAYIYNLYLDRNVAPAPPGPQMLAAMWQMALPAKGLTFDFNGQQSPTLSALQTAAQAGQGLVVQYATYYSTDLYSEAKLKDLYEANGYSKGIENPSTGYIVGTIGAWAGNDPLSTGPCGRLFIGTYPLTRPKRPATTLFVTSYRDHVQAPQAPPSGPPPPPPPPYFLGPMTAFVDTTHQVVVLDLSSTIPETTGVTVPPAPGDLAKMNYGDLTLTIESQGQEQTVGVIQYTSYNRAAYEFSGGILEVPYAAGLADPLADPKGILHLYGTIDGAKTRLSDEIGWAATSTEDRCTYLQLGETASYRVRPLWKGSPMPNQSIPLTLTQWQFTAADNDPGKLVKKLLGQITNGQYVVSQPGNQTYTTDENGYITFSVKGLQPGAAMIRYQAPGDNFNVNQGGGPSPNAYFGLAFYNIFRVLPADNFDDIPNEQVTWDLVYQNVIRYFYLIYPAMFVRLAFQNEQVAQRNASNIAQLIDESLWDNTSYMPVSRDLSDGKRKLLQRWCGLNQ